MIPFTLYTGRILMQTTPSHLITQLDKILREASTLDGVLEFRDEHFWTLSFGVLVGSLHVRIRRDADEQLVLAHVWNKLAGVVQILTVHIFKDDWMRRTTHQLIYNQNNLQGRTINQMINTNNNTVNKMPILNNLNNNRSTMGGFPMNLNTISATIPEINNTTTTSQINLDNDYVFVNKP
jgi:solute carrier family 30 (zinc transporter), member 6